MRRVSAIAADYFGDGFLDGPYPQPHVCVESQGGVGDVLVRDHVAEWFRDPVLPALQPPLPRKRRATIRESLRRLDRGVILRQELGGTLVLWNGAMRKLVPCAGGGEEPKLSTTPASVKETEHRQRIAAGQPRLP